MHFERNKSNIDREGKVEKIIPRNKISQIFTRSSFFSKDIMCCTLLFRETVLSDKKICLLYSGKNNSSRNEIFQNIPERWNSFFSYFFFFIPKIYPALSRDQKFYPLKILNPYSRRKKWNKRTNIIRIFQTTDLTKIQNSSKTLSLKKKELILFSTPR